MTAGFTLLTSDGPAGPDQYGRRHGADPAKGNSPSLVSYGGSSLVMNLASLGIILSLTRGTTLRSAAEPLSNPERGRLQLVGPSLREARAA